MQRVLVSVMTLAFCIGLWLPDSQTAAPIPKDRLKPLYYFSTEVGTKLVFKDEEGKDEQSYKVTAVEQKKGVITVTVELILNNRQDGRRVLTESVLISEEGIFRCELNGEKLTPPLCLLKLPYKVNAEWDISFETRAAKSKGTARSGKAEEVKVPAGTYTAIPVTYDYVINDIPRTMTCWYAHGVGLVKHEYVEYKKPKVDVLVSQSVSAE